MNKKQRKQRVKEWARANLAEAIADMPISPDLLLELLNHLDENLQQCDHTRRLTEAFFANEQGCNQQELANWFDHRAVNCDCEIANNLRDFAEAITHVPQRFSPANQGTQNEPREVNILDGWNFDSLPTPWKVANLYRPEEPLRLQFGKKPIFTIKVIENESLGLRSDAFWIRKWNQATVGSNNYSGHEVIHGSLLSEQYDSVVVKVPRSVCVVGWVYHKADSYHFEVCSELARFKTDWAAVTDLFTVIDSRFK